MKRILLALALIAPAAAFADIAPPRPTPPAPAPPPAPAKPRPVQVFGEGNPNCAEWTDGCIVCKRQDDRTVACSMVGVACLPAEPACTRKAP